MMESSVSALEILASVMGICLQVWKQAWFS